MFYPESKLHPPCSSCPRKCRYSKVALSHFAFRKKHKHLSLQTERNPRRIFHFYEKGQKVKVVSGICFARAASPGSFLEPCWASQHLVPTAVNPVWEHLCASSPFIFRLLARPIISDFHDLCCFCLWKHLGDELLSHSWGKSIFYFPNNRDIVLHN